MKNPLISVVVPIYNAEKTLTMCLNSLCFQTYPNIEIIMVNDGSKDGSENICLKFCEMDNRFKYIYKENGGLSDARNAGIKEITGDYVMFLDSDDELATCCVEYLVSILEKGNVDIVSFNFTMEYDELSKQPPFEYNDMNLVTTDILKEYFLKEVAVTNRIFKKEIIDGVHFIKGQISEDVIYLFKCYAKAESLYKTEYKFYYYNQDGTESITRSGTSIRDNSSVEACKTVLNMCKTTYNSCFEMANLQCMHAMFNIINKSVIRGFKDSESREYYSEVIPQYRRELKKNLFKILKANTLGRNVKLQITIVCISMGLFKVLKRFYWGKLR